MNKTSMIRFLNSLNKLENHKKELRSKSKLSIYLNDVLIGLLLSDGYLERSSPTSGVRLTVSFGVKHLAYLMYLFNLLEPYTNTEPTSISVYNKQTKTNYEVCRFKTVSLPQLLYYYELFYKVNSEGKFIKVIPLNIEELLSPVVLAHLLMGDGNIKQPDKIIRIYTNSFSHEEVSRLALAITRKLNILTKVVHDRNNQYMITISKSELYLVQELIKPHIHPSMYYKIDLDSNGLESFNYKDIAELQYFSPDCVNYFDIYGK
jgi:hypothetical protein